MLQVPICNYSCFYRRLIVTRALTWESSCTIANTFKNIVFVKDMYQHYYKVHDVIST